MTRIILLGCAGSGKTTLARRLAAATGAPVIDLDDIWRTRSQETPEFRETLAALHAGEGWISDGNFAAVSFDLRLPRADLVVWLERPRLVCAWRAVTRVFRPGELHRPGDLMTVLQFIWGFNRRNRPRIEAGRKQYGAKVQLVRLRTDQEVEAFVRGIGPQTDRLTIPPSPRHDPGRR